MMLFNKLAEALVKEGKNDKALEVLDKCMQVLPPENVRSTTRLFQPVNSIMCWARKKKRQKYLQASP